MKIPESVIRKYRLTCNRDSDVLDVDARMFLDAFDEPPRRERKPPYFSVPSRVLVIGCYEEATALMLAEAGFDVTGIDLRGWDPTLPPCNFTFIRGDFCRWAADEGPQFDAVVSLSAIEHFGLGTYGETTQHPYYDVLAMNYVHDLLRPGGRAYVSVPVGAGYVVLPPHWRIYNLLAARERLVQRLTLEKIDIMVAGKGIFADGHPAPRELPVGTRLNPDMVFGATLLPLDGHPPEQTTPLPHMSGLFVMRKQPDSPTEEE